MYAGAGFGEGIGSSIAQLLGMGLVVGSVFGFSDYGLGWWVAGMALGLVLFIGGIWGIMVDARECGRTSRNRHLAFTMLTSVYIGSGIGLVLYDSVPAMACLYALGAIPFMGLIGLIYDI